MTEFDQKIHNAFPGLVVRKDLVKEVKGNAIVPTYVLEYLLGQYCATDDEDTIKSGIDSVKNILAEHYVHRNEANKVRSEINQKGSKKVIDIISVLFNEKKGVYEATFSNLGISKVPVGEDTIKRNPKILVNGVWCIATISYEYTEEKDSSPWTLEALKPIQLSSFDFESFKAGRSNFTVNEWIDVIMQTIGFDPEKFETRSKYAHLLRLIPYCERNYNCIELGPKGTGKSHIYSEMSPHGMLLSGGEVTIPKLFVNNGNGKIGLVGYWDVVAFDEFAGSDKKVDKALVDIMKNYMANKSFSRGIETLGAEASMVFIGNTKHNVPYMLKHSDLLEELPKSYHDSAFIDRIHSFIPGWEFDSIRFEMFSSGYGFIVDYLAEMLRHMRNYDYSSLYKKYFSLSNEITTRDKDGINKTFSGLAKLLFPDEKITKEEAKMLLDVAIEQRKRVKDQLVRIDATFDSVEFTYTDIETGETCSVKTLEEKTYPSLYYKRAIEEQMPQYSSQKVNTPAPAEPQSISEAPSKANVSSIDLPTGRFVHPEGETGVSYEKLFGPYIVDATEIQIQDPYIQKFVQTKNLSEFIEMIIRLKDPESEVKVTLLTKKEDVSDSKQEERLDTIIREAAALGVNFDYSFDSTNTIHSRFIKTNNGWEISLDRGLDIFQIYNLTDQNSFAIRLQEARKCKTFEVTYLRATDN
jgi:ATP-dependent Lon protease